MADYITAAELKATLSMTGTTFADADIADAVTAASRAIDEYCSRRFFVTALDETRYFTPRRLYVDLGDLASLTSFATDAGGGTTFADTWAINTDLLLHPLNADLDAVPWNRAHRHPNSSKVWPPYPRSVKVVGKFGWTTAPAHVTQACTIIAQQLLIAARNAPLGFSAGLDGSPATRIAQIDPRVRMLLDPLRKEPFS